jgi:hypothetical protein
MATMLDRIIIAVSIALTLFLCYLGVILAPWIRW